MFNISFLNSAILGALIAGIIPLIIHFFVKYKPNLVKFSSLKFIKKIQQNKARYIKIRQLLLLIIRILIILLIILALSRPVIKSLFTSENWENHAPTSVVMIVDNSFSMNYLHKEKTVLEQAKTRTKTILNMLSDKDQVMLLTLDQNYNHNHKYFTAPENLKEQIESVSITDNAVKLQKVLEIAQKELNEVDEINTEVYVLTDGQQYNWQNLAEEKIALKSDVFVMTLFPDEDISFRNITTMSASFVPAILTESKNPEVRAVIKNFADVKQEDILVRLIVNNVTQAEKAISFNPNQKKSVVFDMDISSQNKNSYAEVRVKDQLLPDDNTWYFDFNPSQSPAILMVADNNLGKELTAALSLITGETWEKLKPRNLNSEKLEQYNFIIVYKILDISEKFQYHLNTIVEQKKSLMIIPGEEPARGNLEKFLQDLQVTYKNINTDVSKINYLNYLHPITSVFTKEMFNQVRIEKMWNISAPEFTPLLGTPQGTIFSIKDKILLSSLNFTPGWANLIYESEFPVLFYNIANYLGMVDASMQPQNVGVPFEISQTGNLSCRLPTGEVVPLIVEQGNTEKFTNTDWQGHYFVMDENNEIQRILSYNSTRKESDLSSLTDKEIKNMHENFPKLHFLNDKNWKKNILTSRYGYGLWKIILWIVLALLVLEMMLAYSGKKSRGGGK
ncbi:MAG: BatA and WFA domain-containing protein [Candidatus Cloacimonetes bacterium]|nr:BatA and WFA domain-containing protein [Candidatus Cloacimonadota bacterium]MBS3768162.1 BatA and WFA domain-containing protein [Candidatus Cloacimonadota bacterium]